VAWCLDRAVTTFGSVTESQLSHRDKSGRPRYTLAQLLADPPKRGERRVVSRATAMQWGAAIKVKVDE